MEKRLPIRVSARALVVNENREILMVREKESYWYTPGGGLEDGESLTECVKREVLEETGLEIEVGRVVLIEEYFEGEKHFLCVYFLASTKGEIASDWKDIGGIVEAKFLTKEEVLAEDEIYPKLLKRNFWELLETNFEGFDPYNFDGEDA